MSLEFGFNNLEMIRIARDYADQKGIDFGEVVKAMEEALLAAESKRYNYDKLSVSIDSKTGRITVMKKMLVVSDEEYSSGNSFIDDYQCVPLAQAVTINANAKVGEIIEDIIPSADLDRSKIGMVRSVLSKALNTLVRIKQYNDFKERVGEIISGIVKRVDNNSITVDINNEDVVIPARYLIKGELYRKGDRVKSYLSAVHSAQEGSQLVLSRVHPDFVLQLLRQEVPEVYDGIVHVKSIARSPGSRSKVAVFASESSIDAVGACVGIRGARIRAISDELRGEKIDVVEYSSDPVAFAINALAPATINKVVMDEEDRRIQVVVPEGQLSVAIGRKGQNVGLASVLIGWKIEVLSEEQEAKLRADEMSTGTELFMKHLDVEEIIAQLLVTEGYDSVSSIANAPVEELASIEGFDTAIAEELIRRASNYIKEHGDDSEDVEISGGLSNSTGIASLELVTPELLLLLNEGGIENVEQVADMSVDEFRDLIPDFEISDQDIGDIIMSARRVSGWFEE